MTASPPNYAGASVRGWSGAITLVFILFGAATDARTQTPDGSGTGLPVRGTVDLGPVPAPVRGTVEVEQFPPVPSELPPPATAPPVAPVPTPAQWSDVIFGHEVTTLPATLLWTPMMANALQPRMALERTTLENFSTTKTIDTEIGREFGISRASYLDGDLLGQIDVFAVVLGRFSNYENFTAADFRFGIPFTFSYDDWHWKIAYEHTSTHLGDNYIQNTGAVWRPFIRDELVLGLDHVFWNQLRIYGVFGECPHLTAPTASTGRRFDWGVEWSRRETTGFYGQPFAAFDMELRAEQNYTANCTVQAGWQWYDAEYGHSLRVGAEYYTGDSPYGQFYRVHESWAGLGVWFDY